MKGIDPNIPLMPCRLSERMRIFSPAALFLWADGLNLSVLQDNNTVSLSIFTQLVSGCGIAFEPIDCFCKALQFRPACIDQFHRPQKVIAGATFWQRNG